MEKATLTVSEVAEYLGVCPDTVYAMVRDRQINHFRVRNRILFRKESIDAWMDTQEKSNYQAFYAG